MIEAPSIKEVNKHREKNSTAICCILQLVLDYIEYLLKLKNKIVAFATRIINTGTLLNN